MRFRPNGKDASAGFTLIEVIMVVVILGVVAGFGLLQFSRMILETKEQNVVNQLKAIHAANEVYSERKSTAPLGYLSGANMDLDDINTNLGLSIFADGVTYDYSGGGNNYTVTATVPGSGGFELTLDQTGTISCTTGPCPTL